jgi:hypothetical protein
MIQQYGTNKIGKNAQVFEPVFLGFPSGNLVCIYAGSRAGSKIILWTCSGFLRIIFPRIRRIDERGTSESVPDTLWSWCRDAASGVFTVSGTFTFALIVLR